MLTLHISKADYDIAKVQRLQHLIHAVRKRMEVIFQIYYGASHGQAAKLSGVSANSVTKYVQIANEFGVEELMKFKYKGSESILKDQMVSLKEYFGHHPPVTCKEAREAILKLTKTELSVAHTSLVSHQMGFKPLKAGHVPGKADVEKQAIFKQETPRTFSQICSRWQVQSVFYGFCAFYHATLRSSCLVHSPNFCPHSEWS